MCVLLIIYFSGKLIGILKKNNYSKLIGIKKCVNFYLYHLFIQDLDLDRALSNLRAHAETPQENAGLDSAAWRSQIVPNKKIRMFKKGRALSTESTHFENSNIIFTALSAYDRVYTWKKSTFFHSVSAKCNEEGHLIKSLILQRKLVR